MSTLSQRLSRIAFWGLRCKCGARFEDHTYCGDFCPYFPGMPSTHFTPEDRLSFDDAWFEAHHRYCNFEIPMSCYGCTDATICGRQIPANSDPCVEYCFKHLTEGVGQ